MRKWSKLRIHSKAPACLTIETSYRTITAIIQLAKFCFTFTTSNLESSGSFVMCITDLMKGWDCLNNKGEPIVVRKYGFKAENLAAMQRKKYFLALQLLYGVKENHFLCASFIFLKIYNAFLVSS